MNSHPGDKVVAMGCKVPSYWHVEIMFNVKNVTFKCISDSVYSLCHIFNVVTIAFQAINKIVAFVGAITYSI